MLHIHVVHKVDDACRFLLKLLEHDYLSRLLDGAQKGLKVSYFYIPFLNFCYERKYRFSWPLCKVPNLRVTSHLSKGVVPIPQSTSIDLLIALDCFMTGSSLVVRKLRGSD